MSIFYEFLYWVRATQEERSWSRCKCCRLRAIFEEFFFEEFEENSSRKILPVIPRTREPVYSQVYSGYSTKINTRFHASSLNGTIGNRLEVDAPKSQLQRSPGGDWTSRPGFLQVTFDYALFVLSAVYRFWIWARCAVNKSAPHAIVLEDPTVLRCFKHRSHSHSYGWIPSPRPMTSRMTPLYATWPLASRAIRMFHEHKSLIVHFQGGRIMKERLCHLLASGMLNSVGSG